MPGLSCSTEDLRSSLWHVGSSYLTRDGTQPPLHLLDHQGSPHECYLNNKVPTQVWGFPCGSVIKNLLANVGVTGEVGSTPGLGGSPGGEDGNLFKYSFWDNPMDRGVWEAAVHRG